MRSSPRVPMDVIDTIYTLPQRYYPAMLHVLLSLRRLPQERFDAIAEAVSLRASERSLDEGDVEELAILLGDRRAADELFDWFFTTPSAWPEDVRKRLERARVATEEEPKPDATPKAPPPPPSCPSASRADPPISPARAPTPDRARCLEHPSAAALDTPPSGA